MSDEEEEVPLVKFDSKDEIGKQVQSIMVKVTDILKAEIPNYPHNFIFGMSLLWDVAIKDETGSYEPSTYAIATRPVDPNEVDRMVDELLSKDPVIVESFLRQFAKTFYDLYVFANTSSAITDAKTGFHQAQHAQHEAQKTDEQKKLDKRNGMHVVKNDDEDKVN